MIVLVVSSVGKDSSTTEQVAVSFDAVAVEEDSPVLNLS